VTDTQSTYPVPKPYLTSGELQSTPLPKVRRGGIDPKVVGEIRRRAASTIDALYATIDKLQSELNGHLGDADADQTADTASAARLLEAATRTADALIVEARSRADELDEETARRRAEIEAELVAEEARRDEARARIAEEVAEAEAAADARRAQIEAEVERWDAELDVRRDHILGQLSELADLVTAVDPRVPLAGTGSVSGLARHDTLQLAEADPIVIG